jgi:hypothetical protein
MCLLVKFSGTRNRSGINTDQTVVRKGYYWEDVYTELHIEIDSGNAEKRKELLSDNKIKRKVRQEVVQKAHNSSKQRFSEIIKAREEFDFNYKEKEIGTKLKFDNEGRGIHNIWYT